MQPKTICYDSKTNPPDRDERIIAYSVVIKEWAERGTQVVINHPERYPYWMPVPEVENERN